MKLAIMVRLFLFFVIGASLFACGLVWPKEHAQTVPTRLPPMRQETPTTVFQVATTVSPAPVERQSPTMKIPADALKITIVYDNHAFDPRLKAAWGFSALLECRGQTLLFDTGRDGRILIENMRVLGIDLSQIQSVILSHAHGDHTGGLVALFDSSVRPSVYLLPSFANTYKKQVDQFMDVFEVTSGQALGESILTTGEISGNIPEQALLVRTEYGLVIITGCAHPGIVRIIEKATGLTNDPVYLVLGGFHLGDKNKNEISAIIADFRRLGVQKVAPCHCTGERAIALFAHEYGENFIPVGAGSIITLEE